jgi:hypothetical protein
MNNESVRQVMMAATKWVRVARVMVTAMRVAGDKEGQGDKEDDGVNDKVACNKEGNVDGYKSDGDKGDGQAMATRAMVTAKGNNNQPVRGATKAGSGWQESINKAITRPQRWATTNNKSVRRMMMAATKRARVERAMVTAMRMAGKEEGKGNEEEDVVATRVACNQEGNGDGCKSNGDLG